MSLSIESVITDLGSKTFGVTVKDVPADAFVAAYAQHLKRGGKIKLPSWIDVVKTARFKQLGPQNPDWFFIRTASVARKVYLQKGIGVTGFSKIYGGRHKHGVRRRHFKAASTGIIKECLRQLQALEIVELDPKKGRRITPKGQKELDTIAVQLKANSKFVLP
eukprot:TRINITY_DN147_c0_g2_i1.p1 TRINITY_DN147_c0_g2~~TRINITY_DN147_c0_g2_i1.p1  ORF type:complete len:163 (-),score=29.32 TRINITY_DN147_c0_g2_i1:80-568(-)